MRKQLGVVLAALLAITFLFEGTASAFQRESEWCAEDPMFHVLGTHFTITTHVHARQAEVSGIAYDVVLPSNAGDVKVNYPGGKRIPTTVNIARTGTAYDGSGSFSVSVTETATGPAGREVVVYVSGAAGTFNGTTEHSFEYHFSVAAK